jgi:hypothetical protein
MPGQRGGKRNGKVGTAYKQRSDLNGGPQPISATPGQAYGAAGAQLAAQRAVPMGSPDVAGQPAPGPLPSHIPMPGQLGDLLGESQDPNEHVMNGSALGPGAGPEALGLAPGQSTQMDVQKLIAWLPALEHIANGPNASDLTRQMVRIIKMNVNLTPGVQQ